MKCDTFWPPDRPTRNQTTAHQKKRQLRAANLREGECNINRTYYIIIYCICMYMHVVMPCACARARANS